MAELTPYPFASMVERMFTELETSSSIFDFPAKKFFTGQSGKDYSVAFHNKNASSPLAPASGPHTQMAQNIVMSWLAGARIMELKTVQILDELDIPRPCIDMQTVGYNVEWSQELLIEQSLHEYVKGSMLIEILKASGKIDVQDNFGDVIFDMSVGYDLKGIQSEKVSAFIEGMLDSSEIVEMYRQQIPEKYQQFKDLEFNTKLSDTLTLSTFHGCPPEEIEKIIDYLFRQYGINCIIKLNPTLLGSEKLRGLFNDILGYSEIKVPDEAFENDASWEQAQGFVERLGKTAESLNLNFGVKFNNTLIVENHRDFFPKSEKVMYLSGTPLHVLGINLVQKFRERFGDQFPISFSAGIDKGNFPDAVALGLTPISVCSDLLKVGGYPRASAYYKDFNSKMDKLNVSDIPSYIIKSYGNAEAGLDKIGLSAGSEKGDACRNALNNGDDLREAAGDEVFEQWLSAVKLLNTETYVSTLHENIRYSSEKNSKPPNKVGTSLSLFDCLTCDKCIPVCPNNANFALAIPAGETEVHTLSSQNGSWSVSGRETLKLEKKHQIANFADFCNECGNCDIFCPEDGGPYLAKPRFFGSMESYQLYNNRDGFYLSGEDNNEVYARFEGKAYQATFSGDNVTFSGPDFKISFSGSDPENTVSGEAGSDVSLENFRIMEMMRNAIADTNSVSYVSVL